MRWAILLVILHSLPVVLSAQESPRPLLPRSVTVTAGVGNAMGWFGAQGEHYLGDERVSLFVGLGYTPRFDQSNSHGLTFAGGLRGFTRGDKHRAFLEGSLSQLFVESGPLGADRRLYGPGLQAGYQFVARGGFTFMASLGAGYAPGVSRRGDGWAGLLGLAAGYTWRRMSQRDLRPMP
ncbi:MAG: hypothetical protein QOK27_221 [Gemmatimonadales bacterium]|nr:hypothetical protein [Gemmatimonadales bacterium]